LGITDAHNHIWIEPVPGAAPESPVLNQYAEIEAELKLYRAAGGGSLLDCQPGGCGRNANQLARLSRATGVHIIACTGFHRRKYYPPDHWSFTASSERAAEFFLRELTSALEETKDQPEPIRAGFIKVAIESEWCDSPLAALEGAAGAARQTGSVVEIHTEKGELAEKVALYFVDHGIAPAQLVLCHMDKRPDPGLHADLAKLGALLEYDTFYRPMYDPASNLWPLIQKMTEVGLGEYIALATDMAAAGMYATIGKGPGLASLPGEIKTGLLKMGIPETSIQGMLGGNIARRLAGLE
jgi:phosphotriesterase-related protein